MDRSRIPLLLVIACALAGVLCTVSHNSAATFRLPIFQLWMAAIVFGVAVVIGVISAAAPAWLASRRSVVESMRYVG